MEAELYTYAMSIDSAFYYIELFNWKFDYISKYIYDKNIPYELDMLRNIIKHIKEDELFIDIGGNIGNHSLYIAAQKNINVLYFEPNSNLYNAFTKSIKLNKFEEKIIPYNFGLGSNNEYREFKKNNPYNTGSQELVLGDNGDIPIKKLDELEIDKIIGTIKIDVEGMELDVLEGAINTINKHFPALYIENKDEDDFVYTYNLLSKLGYMYISSFNNTPTHLYVHNSKSTEYEYEIISTLKNLIYENKKNMNTQINNIRNKKRVIEELNTKIDNYILEINELNSKNKYLNNYVDILRDDNISLAKYINNKY